MGIVTGRKALSVKLERATLNWFAMGQQDDEHLAAMRDLYRQIADWDAMDLAMREAGVELDDESPKPVEDHWSEGTFTTEATCRVCGRLTSTTGQRVRVTERMVFVPATCGQCRASGEYGLTREEFERRFPGAKL